MITDSVNPAWAKKFIIDYRVEKNNFHVWFQSQDLGSPHQDLSSENRILSSFLKCKRVKKGIGSNIISPILFRLLGRISTREEEKGTEILEKKIMIKKNGDGKEYQVVGNFIHPTI